jgi:hypothetical protein
LVLSQSSPPIGGMIELRCTGGCDELLGGGGGGTTLIDCAPAQVAQHTPTKSVAVRRPSINP